MKYKFVIVLCLLGTIWACGTNGDRSRSSNSVNVENEVEAPDEDLSETDNEVPEEEPEDEPGCEAEEEPDEPAEEDEPEVPEEPFPVTDFLQRGPHQVMEDGRTAGVTNCANMEYSVYSPVGVSDPPVVVLGHGFARGAGVMVGWADHLSSWGVEVLVPTLCHYNIFNGVDHEMNGQNMKELAGTHGATEVIYAGHSAGGLAAIIAAAQDANAIGVLGLDATDTQAVPGVPDFVGQQYATDVDCPAFSIIAEPSSCNADNNGVNLFSLMGEQSTVKVNSSDHCDFESPTDFLCEANCQNETVDFSDEEIRPAITTLGTAAIMSLAGLSADGDRVWESQNLSNWDIAGLIQEL